MTAILIAIILAGLCLWGAHRCQRAHPSDGDLGAGCMLLACLVGTAVSGITALALIARAALR